MESTERGIIILGIPSIKKGSGVTKNKRVTKWEKKDISNIVKRGVITWVRNLFHSKKYLITKKKT